MDPKGQIPRDPLWLRWWWRGPPQSSLTFGEQRVELSHDLVTSLQEHGSLTGQGFVSQQRVPEGGIPKSLKPAA